MTTSRRLAAFGLVPTVVAIALVCVNKPEARQATSSGSSSSGSSSSGSSSRGSSSGQSSRRANLIDPASLFTTSEDCIACHNSLRTPSGEDVSIGSKWQASIMANSSRDPYWRASVRREILDHPMAAAAIQDECSTCHMPMARASARANGRLGEVFSHLLVKGKPTIEDRLAHDGVSCTVCHQITSEKFGAPESFTGGFVMRPPVPRSRQRNEPRQIFGPFKIGEGIASVMHSASGFEPAEARHLKQSELCATCHTLITKALGPGGDAIGELHEQTMYLEWRHSAYAREGEERSCQSCHMPAVDVDTPISSVVGQPRPGLARHVFVGGNIFMLRMLMRFREELGVPAPPLELDASLNRTQQLLETATAAILATCRDDGDGRLGLDVAVQNLTGHKLPTGYPSRRVWIYINVTDRQGRRVFESGGLAGGGEILGNRNDQNPREFEPHYTEIQRPDQVQVYESVMGDAGGVPTTGLLSATKYLKDNRLLPRGFNKASADQAIAVVGSALEDADFNDAGDRVRYSVDVSGREGPFRVAAELRFQSIGFRWIENLRPYDAPEPRQFLGYVDALVLNNTVALARQPALTCNPLTPR